jgi:hypothetical protein
MLGLALLFLRDPEFSMAATGLPTPEGPHTLEPRREARFFLLAPEGLMMPPFST